MQRMARMEKDWNWAALFQVLVLYICLQKSRNKYYGLVVPDEIHDSVDMLLKTLKEHFVYWGKEV